MIPTTPLTYWFFCCPTSSKDVADKTVRCTNIGRTHLTFQRDIKVQRSLVTARFSNALQFPQLYCTATMHCIKRHCSAQNCTALHCTAQYCNALHYTALYCTVLHFTALQCTALHCTSPKQTTQHCTLLNCNTILFTKMHCPSLQLTKLHCNSMATTTPFDKFSTTENKAQRNA